MTTVADLTTISKRFGRSVRLDGTATDDALAGYVVTARGLDLLERISVGMRTDSGSRAFSIIGPYGSGKSSFAALLDGLIGGHDDAERLLAAGHADAHAQFRAARDDFAQGRSWVRAVLTAPQREPITTTLLRALDRGCQRDRARKKDKEAVGEMLGRALDPEEPSPTWDEIEPVLVALATHRPVLLVIDEFGKNLEAYAKSDHEADLYLLQQVAETAADRPEGAALLVLTVQHLAFEAYAEASSVQQRREWAKVQGRFEDVPFIDSSSTARSLIATAISHVDDELYAWLRAEVAAEMAARAASLGLPVTDADLIAQCYPLHPTVLAVLPDLCTRFGQNERTLFSFLASGEPLSISARNAALEVAGLPTHRLDTVYDYFVEAASTLAGASSDATRWVEVSTTVRDAASLTEPQQRVLKTIGVLNLVAAYGTARASSGLVRFALVGAGEGLESAEAVDARVAELQHAGILVHRDFADEYRIWRGSDFNLSEALSQARALGRTVDVAATLEQVHPLEPLIAGRHSHERSTVRSFARVWGDVSGVGGPSHDRPYPHDGTIVHLTDETADIDKIQRPEHDYPVIVVRPSDVAGLRDAAREVAALLAVGQDDRIDPTDSAVRRELAERLDHARQTLAREVRRTYWDTARWRLLNPPAGKPAADLPNVHSTAPLSEVFDAAYTSAPRIGYEPLNRHELTSQGSRVRTNLFRALLDPAAWDDWTDRESEFGFVPDSAEASAFHAVFVDSGLIDTDPVPGRNRKVDWRDPDGSETDQIDPVWLTLWNAVGDQLAVSDGWRVTHILETLAAPPYGLREGVAVLLVAAHLIRWPERTALFEHGTFIHTLDDSILERMGRNPANFTVAALNADPGTAIDKKLRRIADALAATPQLARHADRLGLDDDQCRTVVGLSKWIAYVLHRHTDAYTSTTRAFGMSAATSQAKVATTVRDVIAEATRPDRMLYRDLPDALGYGRVDLHGNRRDGLSEKDATQFGKKLARALATIDAGYDTLASKVASALLEAADTPRLGLLVDRAEELRDADEAPLTVRTLVLHLLELPGKLDGAANPQRVVRDWLNGTASALTGKPLTHWRDADTASLTEQMAATVAELVRLSRLERVNRGDDDGTLLSLVMQRAGNDRTDDIIALPSDRKEKTEKALDEALSMLDDDSDALEHLLAVTASRWMSHRSGTMRDHGPTGKDH